jgi:hypothetical protein
MGGLLPLPLPPLPPPSETLPELLLPHAGANAMAANAATQTTLVTIDFESIRASASAESSA